MYKVKKRKNKYRNIKCTVNNIKFASKKEATRYLCLLDLSKRDKIRDLKLQPKFTFPMGFSYIADFQYNIPEGRGDFPKAIVEDVKGIQTKDFILKKKCFKYFFTQYELRIIK